MIMAWACEYLTLLPLYAECTLMCGPFFPVHIFNAIFKVSHFWWLPSVYRLCTHSLTRLCAVWIVLDLSRLDFMYLLGLRVMQTACAGSYRDTVALFSPFNCMSAISCYLKWFPPLFLSPVLYLCSTVGRVLVQPWKQWLLRSRQLLCCLTHLQHSIIWWGGSCSL